MTRISANLLMLAAGLAWGMGFIAQATAMDDIGPFLFMAMRFPLAALALLPFAIAEWRRAKAEIGPDAWRPENNRSLLFVGVVFFIAMAMQQVGLLATSVTNAGMLTGLYVVLVPLILHLTMGRKQPASIWLCAAAAFLGIWMLGGGGLDRLTWGDWVVILGALFAALHVIVVGETVMELRLPFTLACAQFAVSGVLSWVCFAAVRAMDWSLEPPASMTTILAATPEILYAAFVAGAFAFTIMAICQQFTSASDAAILLSSEALFAALGGAIMLGERLDRVGYAGCALLFVAIAATSFLAARQEEFAAKS